jgi:hypothetical protein
MNPEAADAIMRLFSGGMYENPGIDKRLEVESCVALYLGPLGVA